MLLPDLGRDTLGELHHGLGHLYQLVEVLEGLGNASVILPRLLTDLLFYPCDASSDLSLGRGLLQLLHFNN